jgi:hypothetical protein
MTTPLKPPSTTPELPVSLADTPPDNSALSTSGAGIKSVCVFCGSSSRVDQSRKDEATALGQALAKAGLELVYGGGRVGLMGLVADAAMQGGARVSGVIPKFLHDHEVAHTGVTDLEITDSMHDRKRRMYELSDAFVILPGGLGTLDETMEVLTWTQLGLSQKPVIICNFDGFWQPLLDLIDHTIAAGFTRPENRSLFTVVERIEDIIPALRTTKQALSDPSGKWI